MVVLPTHPDCDTNTPVLVMCHKQQLTTHQSLWDSPILFRGEWIILSNPNTLFAPLLQRTITLGRPLPSMQITLTKVRTAAQIGWFLGLFGPKINVCFSILKKEQILQWREHATCLPSFLVLLCSSSSHLLLIQTVFLGGFFKISTATSDV